MRPRAEHQSQTGISRASAKCVAAVCERRARVGFSLVELLVVLSITVLLTGLLMPALRQVRENANRVMCMSNLQQMASAFVMYDSENKGWLPYSNVLHKGKNPRELMQARTSGIRDGWDGLGLLYSAHYCNASECFYCPSHHGDHPFERYAHMWDVPARAGLQIFTNYHYSGDVNWDVAKRTQRRKLDEGNKLVLMTDGLRTLRDFNHVSGINVLRADGSVRWQDDAKNVIKAVTAGESDPTGSRFCEVWDIIEKKN